MDNFNAWPEPLRELIKTLAISTPFSPLDWARVIDSAILHDARRRMLAGEGMALEPQLAAYVGSMSPQTFDPWIAAEIGTCSPFIGQALRLHLEGVNLKTVEIRTNV